LPRGAMEALRGRSSAASPGECDDNKSTMKSSTSLFLRDKTLPHSLIVPESR
jgi:hypothetical protein